MTTRTTYQVVTAGGINASPRASDLNLIVGQALALARRGYVTFIREHYGSTHGTGLIRVVVARDGHVTLEPTRPGSGIAWLERIQLIIDNLRGDAP